MVHQKGGLVVRHANRFGAGEPGIQVGDLQHIAALERRGKGHLHLPAPLRTCLPLLVYGNAFGQPARHTLVGELERDHVRQLVPERRLP